MEAGTAGTGGREGFVRGELRRFWSWYERNYRLNVTIALGLFVLQLFHLLWLTLDVVALRSTGTSLFPASGALLGVLVIVDLFEIPALFSVSLVYIHELRKKKTFKNILYLVLLNSQWVHILWITDEFVVEQFAGSSMAVWPMWLAWVAIAIDYLELPVMFDTAKRFLRAVRNGGSVEAVKEALSEETPPEAESAPVASSMTISQVPTVPEKTTGSVTGR